MKKQIMIDLLLFFCGAIMVYEFFIIATQGRIYCSAIALESAVVLGMETVGAIGIIGLGLIHSIKPIRMGSTRHMMVDFCLAGIGCGFLFQFIMAWIYGGPSGSYYGQESNTTILLGEIILFMLFALFGLGNAVLDWRRLAIQSEWNFEDGETGQI